MATLKNMTVTIDGRPLSPSGDDMQVPNRFEASGNFEPAIPRDVAVLRSVSPAAKKAIARRWWQNTFWGLVLAVSAPETTARN